jgi:hypothetical protein
VSCVGCNDYDEKPHLFVSSAWFDNLHSRHFSVFALIDAIGVKSALKNGQLTRESLLSLRNRIDAIAGRYPEISFVSFGDSLLLKSNWLSGNFEKGIKYNYRPEIMIEVVAALRAVFLETLGMKIYAVLGQGSNEWYEDSLLHISEPLRNHVSLNSLGLPFAQLFAIDSAARLSLKQGRHGPAELYMDDHFFHSLNLKHEVAMSKNKIPSYPYESPMIVDESSYYIAEIDQLLADLEPKKEA